MIGPSANPMTLGWHIGANFDMLNVFSNGVMDTTANGYMAYVYDLDTGQLIFNGSSTQGAVGVGGATTLLTTGWLVEVKDVDVPWKAAAVSGAGQAMTSSSRALVAFVAFVAAPSCAAIRKVC